MNTIESLEKDIFSQTSHLLNFKFPKILPIKQQQNSIFCGSGDSLAAAMLAQSHSNYNVKAVDPLDFIKNKNIFQKNTVYVISISGKTISNVKVAKIAKKSSAITSNPQSKLAQVCDELINLQFPNSDVFTAGSISFLNSALTCISLVKKIQIPDSHKIFNHALKQSKNIKLGKKIFFLGNLETFPIAMYGAAKIYEILGLSAYYEKIEQFSHMELFSCSRGDTVIIFEKLNAHNKQLSENLKKIGINVIHPNPTSNDLISQFLFFTFFSQLMPLFLAKKNGQKDCHFVTSKKLRSVSDNMIY